MNVQRIANMVRRKTHVNTTQYTNDELLEDLNELKDELWSAIAHRLQDDYNWESWLATTAANETEYTVPEAASNLSGLKMVKGVAIAYGDETYPDGSIKYEKASLTNPNTLPKHWNWYVNNQPTSSPLYFVSDRSIFIAPSVKSGQEGADRLQITGLRNITDWDINTDESEMRIPVDFQRVLVYGLIPRALASKGDATNEILAWENKYELEKDKSIKNMSNRVDTAIIMEYADDLYNEDDLIRL